MFKTIYQKVFKRFNSVLNIALYDILDNNYVGRFPQLKNSPFSRDSRNWINHNIEVLGYDESENFIYLKKDSLFLVTTPNYSHILKEIFCWNIYFFNPLYLKSTEYLVFDMGMNRGYATLYFANQEWCKGVYGFELNTDVFKIAQKNIELNRSLKSKIEIFNFGLGEKDETIKSYYLPNRDGICTTSKEFLSSYAPEELKNVIETESVIRKTSLVLKEILDRNNDLRIIVKIDVEGAEYNIFSDIIADYPDFFKRVDIIIGDAHMGLQPLVNALKPFGYKEVSNNNLNPNTQDFLFIKQ